MRDLLFAAIPKLTEEQCDKFVAYYRLLIEWNERMNLTAITEVNDVVYKHFADSLAAEPYLRHGARVIDVGTGAGFPSVPLMIMRPDLRFTLVDGLNKRIVFLEALLSELGLSADCIHARAEDLGRDKAHRGAYDHAVSRAVAQLRVLLELTIPLVKVGGSSICYKGVPDEELVLAKNALRLLGCDAKRVDIAAPYGVRSLIVCTKIAPTSGIYPRKAGTPTSTPL